MKRDPMPLGLAIFCFIAGLFLGSIFTFGMQYWNEEVTRDACTQIETQFVSYEVNRNWKRGRHVKDILIDCTNGERYTIDGVVARAALDKGLDLLSEQDEITLLIHPHQDTIVEFSCRYGDVLTFEDTISKLDSEASGFLFLGFFLYFCALVGLYYIVIHIIHKRKSKKKHLCR